MEDEPVFAIFEGGGAKGLTHVGALTALEALALQPVGVAGASAGAIVAALIAVGLTARQIFDADGDNILAEFGKGPLDILGRHDWRVYRALRSWGWLLLPVLLLPVLAVLLLLVVAGLILRIGRINPPYRLYRHFGWFSTEGARDLLDAILHRQVPDVPEGQPVCFGDIEPRSGRPFRSLKIVATDIDSGVLRVFDRNSPDIAVADAVAASIAIPLFFQPAAIRVRRPGGDCDVLASRFADGGLIANLPIYVFNDEKLALERDRPGKPPIPVVGFALAAGNAPGKPAHWWYQRLLAFLATVVRTGIFGSQTATRRFVASFFPVPMHSPLGVLAFDCSHAAAASAVAAGNEQARRRLVELRNRPAVAQTILAAFADAFAEHSDVPVAHFRIAIVIPFGSNAFRVAARYNMDGDPDDRMVLDARNPGAPLAWSSRDATYLDLTADPPPLLHMTKYERALVRPGLRAVVSIPIYDEIDYWSKPPAERPPPRGVVAIDSSEALENVFTDDDIYRWLIENSVPLAPLARALADELAEESR